MVCWCKAKLHPWRPGGCLGATDQGHLVSLRYLWYPVSRTVDFGHGVVDADPQTPRSFPWGDHCQRQWGDQGCQLYP